MKQKLLVTMLIVILVPQLCKAQVYDEEKRLQWRSMETGPLEFEPRFYYWLFHNNYASITTMPTMNGNGSGTDCSIAASI